MRKAEERIEKANRRSFSQYAEFREADCRGGSEGKRDLSIQDVIQFLEQFKETPSSQEFQLEREKLKEQINQRKKSLRIYGVKIKH